MRTTGHATSRLVVQHALAQSYVLALQDAFWFTLVILAAALVAVCFIRKRRPTTSHATPQVQQRGAQQKEAALVA